MHLLMIGSPKGGIQMAIPDFQAFMLPLLEFSGDQREHSMSEAVVYLADCFKLGNEERNELLPSGQQRRLDNRVGWARTHLTKAGLLETTKMSHFRITPRGLEALQEHPAKIDLRYRDRCP